VAATRKVRLEWVESTITGDMDVRGALGVDDEPRNGFERISVSFRVMGDAPEEELREVVERARKRSAVYDMVTNGVPVAVGALPLAVATGQMELTRDFPLRRSRVSQRHLFGPIHVRGLNSRQH
jgi:hypothetical protein